MRICPNCGSSLDAGETCDCRRPITNEPKEEETKYLSPHDIPINTMVSEEIMAALIKRVPPVRMTKSLLQFSKAGQPSYRIDPSDDFEKPFYTTFLKVGKKWRAFGMCVTGGLQRERK